jgi:FkbM family methyltransferase
MIIRNFFPSTFNVFKKPYQKSYSQTGEDLILSFYLCKKQGFYVDVGCHDPIILNNTYLFYENGWKGINIDANPKCIEKFNLVRKRDINVCALIGNSNKAEKFYIFKPETLSTMSEKQKKLYLKAGYKLRKAITTPCISLLSLLKQKLSNNVIDFLSVDVEGNELEVLRSNDWKIYRPKFVIVEVTQHTPAIKNTKPFDDFFKKNKYSRFSETLINSIYISDEYKKKLQIKII